MGSNDVSLVDAARGFAGVPKEYSPAPIWWWSAEKLDRARLRWQLEQFAAGGVFNLVILNLAPTGPLYGSDADDPPFFSEAWWEIFLGVCADARELGVRLWFYDQIGFSGANLQGGLVRENPQYAGQWLASKVVEGEGDLAIDVSPRRHTAGSCRHRPGHRRDDHYPSGKKADLRKGLPGRGRRPPVGLPGRGTRRVRVIYAVRRGYDYFGREACATLLDTVHGEFERRASEFFGDVIVGSFQDELPSMPTWGEDFLAAFAARNGYDLTAKAGTAVGR